MKVAAAPTTIRLETGPLAYGPHAVARHEGRVVFVRGAAPDEAVDAVITEEHGRHAFAAVRGVVQPSPQRRTTACAYLPRCGGCPWQHVTYAAQLASKRQIVADQLRRIGHIAVDVAPVIPSPAEYRWRRRIKLRADGPAVGFYAGASHDLVAIEHCLLAEPAVEGGIAAATDLVRRLTLRVHRIEVSATGMGDGRVVVAAEVEGSWDASAAGDCRRWLAAHVEVAGLLLRGRGWRRTWGDLAVRFEPEPGVLLTAHAPAFTQVNPAVNQLMVEHVVRAVAPRPGQRVLDLYAGAGNLSIPLRSRGAAVLAVEADADAAAAAVRNARRTPGPPLDVRRETAERVVGGLARAGARFDVVVLDPPRGGAAGCVPALLRIAAPRIVYVSCDPATLARDLASLRTHYRIDSVQPFDMFPQTYHVETVVHASLSCEGGTPGVSSARRHESAEPRRRRRTR
jgi:23S rRNA (uracil1939-C5)-methyltransferase